MSQAINAIIHKMPFNKLLGMRAVSTHKDGITIECKLRPELLNFAGVLHGGVTATMADAAVGIALWKHFKGTRKHTTVEMAQKLTALGFGLVTTDGTHRFLEGKGISTERVNKVTQGRPNIVDKIVDGEIAMVINTTFGKQERWKRP